MERSHPGFRSGSDHSGDRPGFLPTGLRFRLLSTTKLVISGNGHGPRHAHMPPCQPHRRPSLSEHSFASAGHLSASDPPGTSRLWEYHRSWGRPFPPKGAPSSGLLSHNVGLPITIIRQVRDPFIRTFWAEEYASYDPRFMREAIAPIQNRLGQFLLNPVVRTSSARSAAKSVSGS